ncbi:ATP-dependent helicase/deoxyribonuclease subunit B, partial [Staphylococcus simiae CCM 7213 = CCUG 51256]
NDLHITLEKRYFNEVYRFNNNDSRHLEQQFDALQIN